MSCVRVSPPNGIPCERASICSSDKVRSVSDFSFFFVRFGARFRGFFETFSPPP